MTSEQIALRIDAVAAVKTLLKHVGEDPKRDGLKRTPVRVVQALSEMTSGYSDKPWVILARTFESGGYDEMVAAPWVEFCSLCEHHMLPFIGYAHVAYFPGRSKTARVVGASKLARLVECYGRRLQIQERMTMEIADAIQKYLKARDVAVVIQAKHMCMACRGVQKQKAVLVTSAMRGRFRRSASARSEFFKLVELAHNNNGH